MAASGKGCVAFDSADDLWLFGGGPAGGVVTASILRPGALLAGPGAGREEVEVSELTNP